MSQPQQPSALSHRRVTVEIEVSSQLVDDASHLDAVAFSLNAALRYRLHVLGIPDSVEVTVRSGDGDRPANQPIVVRVNGDHVRYSSDLSARVAQYCGVHGEQHSGSERFEEFITLLAVHAIGPPRLFGPAQLAAYEEAMAARGHHAEAKSPYLEGALKLALRMWLSIADVDAVAAAIRGVSHADDAEIQEALVRALRTDHIEIHLPLGYLRQMTDSSADWTGRFSTMRAALALELGILAPPFRFVLDEALNRLDGESAPGFCFKFNALTTPPIRGLSADELLVNDAADRVSRSDAPAVATINAATGRAAAVVAREERERLEASGYVTWDALEYLVLCLAEAVRGRAALLIDQGTVEALLTTLRWQAPRLIDVIDALYSAADVTRLLRSLLADRISIRNLARICNLLADADREPSFEERVSFVRAGMREIGNRLSRSTSVVPVYLLDLAVVDLLERAPAPGLDEASETILANAIQAELNHLPDITPPAIVATPKSRVVLQALMADAFPHVAVTTLAELSDELAIQPIARITI